MLRTSPVERYRTALHTHLPELRERYNVSELWLFGSYVRGKQTPTSDLDVLVTFTRTPSLLKFVALEKQLSRWLGVKVDLVMKTALRPQLGPRILQECVSV